MRCWQHHRPRRRSLSTVAVTLSTLLVVGLLASCAPESPADGEPSPRVRYNQGIDLYEASTWDEAATTFLAARDAAGPDPELRYRAAFNLGMAHSGAADAVDDPVSEDALEQLRQSAAWFRDAVRLSDADDDARINLEIVLRRIQQLTDQLNSGKNTLESRLDRLIEDQRVLRDNIRRLMQTIDDAGANAEPVGFQTDFHQLATFERTLLTEAGTVSDFSGEELSLLENRTPEELSETDQVRIIQLKNLDHYLQQARQALSDTRRTLRRLEGNPAHRRADAGLALLRRAREQLLDPVAVLKGVAEDESVLLTHTQALAQLRTGSIRLSEEQVATPPSWLSNAHLTDRQQDVALRTGEVLERFKAGTADDATANPQQSQAQQPSQQPQQQRMIESARAAIPFLEEAIAAFTAATDAITGDRLDDAARSELESMDNLMRAIERFSAARELIEIAFGDQSTVVALLTPPAANGDQNDPVAELSTDERLRLVREATTRNVERVERLVDLLAEDKQQEEAKAAAAAQQAGAAQQGAAGAAPGAGGTPEMPAEQREALDKRYELAEELRANAATSLGELDAALTALESGTIDDGANPRQPAEATLDHLEELRRLFFSIVQHLQDLLRKQAQTHDQTASAQTVDPSERPTAIGPLVEFQQRHASLGEALAEALAKQADEAAAAGASMAGDEQDDDDGDEEAPSDPLAEAAEEVRGAAGAMADAAGLLTEASNNDAAMSYDFEPLLGHQQTAMEHLEKAIALLKPPSQGDRQQQQQQQDQQQDQQEQQQQQQQQQDEERLSQRQAERRLQAIRERDAERQRNRQQNERNQQEPVEKDW